MVEYSRPVHKLSLIFRHLSAFMLVMYSRRALSVFFFFLQVNYGSSNYFFTGNL